MSSTRQTPDLGLYSVSGFDRGADPIKEALWQLVSFFFFRLPVPLPSDLRAGLLRAFGAAIGRATVIRSGVHITFPWRLTLGDNVWLGENVYILSLAPVRIGNNVCISQRAFLCTGSHNHRKSTFDLITQPITVGDGSWIAAQAFIGPGVEIGAGSVVSAGAVVMESIPAASLARGNPAQISPIT